MTEKTSQTPADLDTCLTEAEALSTDGLLKPRQVPVTKEWRSLQELKQLRYAASRTAWREQFFRGTRQEPETETEKRSRGGTIFDKRQYKLPI